MNELLELWEVYTTRYLEQVGYDEKQDNFLSVKEYLLSTITLNMFMKWVKKEQEK